MLNAIAIYKDCRDQDMRYLKGDFQTVDSMPEKKTGLFANNKVLEDLEKDLNSLPREINGNQSYAFHATGEHHYIVKISDNIVVAISSRSIIIPSELTFLVKNIEHTYYRKNIVTLADIMKNPIGYTNKDVLLHSTLKKVDELKETAMKAVDKVIARGDKIEGLDIKTINLTEACDDFNKEIKKMNKCSC